MADFSRFEIDIKFITIKKRRIKMRCAIRQLYNIVYRFGISPKASRTNDIIFRNPLLKKHAASMTDSLIELKGDGFEVLFI
jgi:hypothetical protein